MMTSLGDYLYKHYLLPLKFLLNLFNSYSDIDVVDIFPFLLQFIARAFVDPGIFPVNDSDWKRFMY